MLQLIGQIVCGIIAAMVASLLFAVLNVRFLAFRRNPLLRPCVALIDFFHLQMKAAYSAVTGSSSAFDQMMVKARNVLNRKRFSASRNRAFLAPHCLRGLECPAVSTQYGIQCRACGQCKLGEIKKACDAHGIRLFILAGSSFVKKLIEESKPDGILLLGCPYEINKVMRHLHAFATHGLLLTRDGCISTDTDVEEIVKAIESAPNDAANATD